MTENAQRLRLVSRFAAVVAVSGSLVLLGWALGNSFLKSFSPGLLPMNPAAAVLLLVVAACLALHTSTVKQRNLVLLKWTLAEMVVGGFWTLRVSRLRALVEDETGVRSMT